MGIRRTRRGTPACLSAQVCPFQAQTLTGGMQLTGNPRKLERRAASLLKFAHTARPTWEQYVENGGARTPYAQ